jgi:N4-gp56 family major capsid protein
MNTVSISGLRKQLWAQELLDDVQRDVEEALQFVGEGPNNVVQVSTKLKTEKGEQESFGLVTRLAGDGIAGDDELEGNEEPMSSYAETVAIDQIRNAVRLKGKLDSQKVVYDQVMKAKDVLRMWLTEFRIRQIFLKLGGVTNTTLVDVNGVVVGGRALWSNTPDYIPDADENAGVGNRYLCANAGGTTALGAGDKMTLDFITKMVTKAKLANPKIQPLESGGEKFYPVFLHPLQARDIRLSADWKTAQQNAQIRGDKNPVFKGALGYWSGALLLENEDVPWLDVSVAGNSFRGAASGTDCAVDCARALLCGRQAVLMSEATGTDDALVLENFDYKNKEGVAAGMIGGVQKAMFNSKEFGVIAGDTAAAV